MTYAQALALIQAEIVANGNNEITANVLRPVLEAMINFPNDSIGVLANLTTSDVSSVVNAINSIVSQNLKNATALRAIDTTGIDFNQDELLWVRDAINQTAANNGSFTCTLGEQMVFYFDVIINNNGSEVTLQRRYYRLTTGETTVNSLGTGNNPPLMPDGSRIVSVSLSGDLVLDLGDIGTDTIEDAFNSDANQPFTIVGDKFVQAVQNSENKLWQWIGGDGTFGNSATLAEATDFVDLTSSTPPPNSNPNVQTVTGDSVDNTDPLNPVVNAVPLSGTEVGSPVTGDIEFVSGYSSNGFFKFHEDENTSMIFRFEDASMFFSVTDIIGSDTTQININKGEGLTISSNSSTSKGFSGNQYYGANYDDNTYVQKKYVDDNFAPVSGVVLESDYNANTILKADTDDTPEALEVAEQTLVGRITGGEITALNATQVKTLLNYLEQQIVGTAAEDLTLTGAENISLSTNADMYLKLTGNTTITFTDTPSVGTSIVRTYSVESDTTETLGIANSTDEFGTYAADGTINEMVVKASNYSTEGLIIRVFFSQPN